MGPFDVLTILLTLSGIFSYLNDRYIKMPITIGVTFIGLVMSLAILILQHFTAVDFGPALKLLTQIDFGRTVFYALLGFLLFAGSLSIDVKELKKERWGILLLSTVSILITTFLVGTLIFWLFKLMQVELSYSMAMVFGALISPTDPVVVLGVLRRKKDDVSEKFYSLMVGESLFNDAMSILIFTIALGIAEFDKKSVETMETFHMTVEVLVQHVFGGIALGMALGIIGVYFLRKVERAHVQILMTLGLVASGYDLSQLLDVSSPLAVVIMGLIVGYYFRKSLEHDEEKIADHLLFSFWEIIDEFLNSFLFIMVGIEILSLPTDSWKVFLMTPFTIVIVLFGRFGGLYPLLKFLPPFKGLGVDSGKVMTWAGMRGGISLALALLLPSGEQVTHILFLTYNVVVFSILVQGLSINRFMNKYHRL